jgi:dephospho-CoA kinase
MKVLGLTGGIGMGKSTAGQLLGQKGLAVIDTDLVARQLVEPGQPALVEIQSAFGPGVLDAEGRLSRSALAKVVFADSTRRHQLEGILHPRIRSAWRAEVERLCQGGMTRSPVVVVIPLLFETHAEREFDSTVCVACSAGTQRERLLARGWSDTEISRRLAAQWPTEKKMAAATHVVWTEGSIEVHSAQWDRLLGEG